ncbi:Transcriptional activator DEMETER [Linum perenne]
MDSRVNFGGDLPFMGLWRSQSLQNEVLPRSDSRLGNGDGNHIGVGNQGNRNEMYELPYGFMPQTLDSSMVLPRSELRLLNGDENRIGGGTRHEMHELPYGFIPQALDSSMVFPRSELSLVSGDGNHIGVGNQQELYGIPYSSMPQTLDSSMVLPRSELRLLNGGRHCIQVGNQQEMYGFPNGFMSHPSYCDASGHVGSIQGDYVTNPCFSKRSKTMNHIAGPHAPSYNNGVAWSSTHSLAYPLAMNGMTSISSTNAASDTVLSTLGRTSAADSHSNVKEYGPGMLIPKQAHFSRSNLVDDYDNSSGLPMHSHSNVKEYGPGMLIPKQAHFSRSNLVGDYDNSSGIPMHGFPTALHPNFDLNSPSMLVDNGVSSTTNSFNFIPDTPGQPRKLGSNQHSLTNNLLHVQASNKGKEKQLGHLQTTGDKANKPSLAMCLQKSREFPPTVVPWPVKESFDSSSGSNIDVTSLYPLVPVTPDQAGRLQSYHQLSASASHSSKGNDGQQFLVTSTEPEVNYHEISSNVADVLSTSVPEPVKEPADSGRKLNLGIDLNRTPVQKPEKRKKHRPKVIVDRNSKREPVANKAYVWDNAANSTENPVGRRTYIRMKGQTEPVKPDADFIKEAGMNRTNGSKEKLMGKRKGVQEETSEAAQGPGSLTERRNHTPVKSSRRALNFDLGLPGDDMTHNSTVVDRLAGSSRTSFNLNVAPACSAQPASGGCPQNQSSVENLHLTAKGRDMPSLNPIPNYFMSLSEDREAVRKIDPEKHMLTEAVRFKAKAPNCEVKQCTPEGSGQSVLQAEHNGARPAGTAMYATQNLPVTLTNGWPYSTQRISPKIDESRTKQIVPTSCQQTSSNGGYNHSTSMSWMQAPRKRKLENAFQTNLYIMPSASADAEKPAKQELSPVEEITRLMECLSLARRKDNNQGREENALVPYKGGGAVVPHEGFGLPKKRAPRPKVDLDPETGGMWKSLIGKEGTKGMEEPDKERGQYWQEQRKIFRGRMDSFIARMHLVQGDRRFSKWKGSVVDSVIGVFLTQNVSDHLSSSAFMSLAARFPLESMKNQTCDRRSSVVIEEPDDCIQSPEGVLSPHDSFGSSIINVNRGSVSYTDSVPVAEDTFTGCISNTNDGSSLSANMQRENPGFCKELLDIWRLLFDEETTDENNVQVDAERSETVEDTNTSNRPINHENQIPPVPSSSNFLLSENLPREYSTFSQELLNLGRLSGDEATKDVNTRAVDAGNVQLGMSLERSEPLEGTSPFNKNHSFRVPPIPSSNYESLRNRASAAEGSELKIKYGECSWVKSTPICSTTQHMSRTSEMLEITAEQSGQTMAHVQPIYPETAAVSPQASWNTPDGLQSFNTNTKFQSEMALMSEHVNVAEELSTQHISPVQSILNNPDSRKYALNIEDRVASETNHPLSQNKMAQPFPEEQVASAKDIHMKNVKAGKQKSQNIKKDSVDWDILRKQVLLNGSSNERSKNNMDSLDYDALKDATVNEISNTIKARGMNNMLAQRIKEFLNRLVADHGSMDLEWLRDAPPDKAKEYLLSIHGLGLKSVECVRLLTLHHVAFPVDTNVGRIAVRLGWVPLRPLPESLRIHDLELYPKLEDVQKYLWPRLCTLTQEELYEFHYQLITFGKVYCTKSKPNCNACPMKAECRHFASAFASARHALPGPQEKSIVMSTIPCTEDRTPEIVINPLPSLPTSEESSLTGVHHNISNSVPIIEEPATPEEEQPELTARDIEDWFYEDPDKIPSIKLNMEEFSANLKNHMQHNMELQTGDMSKALVALHPAAASIPVPQLKNISRLRTEHQVYELPDSHPLLKEMDIREPDDSTPYLLAIWTPGETANSMDPPSRQCQVQESGKLCDDSTCFSCNSIRETNSQIVRGTILIPCRTAMRGRFPLNGTYFQVNEVFADHESSLEPIEVPRAMIWNLRRRTVYFGLSVPSIFKDFSNEEIQQCFWKESYAARTISKLSLAATAESSTALHLNHLVEGLSADRDISAAAMPMEELTTTIGRRHPHLYFLPPSEFQQEGFICLRGFEQKTRAPRPLLARLHLSANKMIKTKNDSEK